eukprot:1743225-Amphidinium_carterae.1
MGIGEDLYDCFLQWRPYCSPLPLPQALPASQGSRPVQALSLCSTKHIETDSEIDDKKTSKH